MPWNPFDPQQQAWAYEQLGKAVAEQWEESLLRQDVETVGNVIRDGARDSWDWLKVHAKGERGTTAKPSGTDNPFKHMRPHPTDPSKVRFKQPADRQVDRQTEAARL